MRVAQTLRVVGLATAVSVALSACGSSSNKVAATKDSGTGTGGTMNVLGTPDAAPPGDGAVAACDQFGRVAACTACLQKNCCAVAASCAKKGGCAENAACIKACDGKTGDTCAQACADKYFAAAGVEYNALVTCMSGSCGTECPFSGP